MDFADVILALIVTCELKVSVAMRCIVFIGGGQQATINDAGRERWFSKSLPLAPQILSIGFGLVTMSIPSLSCRESISSL